MDYDFNILYYIDIYKKWWKAILSVMLISMFLTGLISWFMPTTYVSTVTILSTGGGSSAGSGGSLGRFLGLSGLTGGTSSNDIIISILQSRRMSSDIRDRFGLDKKPGFKYKIETREISAGMAIDIKGSDPLLTEKIANFAVRDLDKINTELDITSVKPMVKVLDPAIRGTRSSRQIPRKILIAGLLSFLLLSLYAFFSDYLKKLKSQ